MTNGVALLDVNVLVALIWPAHGRHLAAQDWLSANRARGWATCPITELGCARVVSGRAVSSGLVSVGEALQRLGVIVEDDHHVFWADDLAIGDERLAAALGGIQGPGQLSDRYLLALAALHGGTLATFDRGLGPGLPPQSPLLAHLEVVPG